MGADADLSKRIDDLQAQLDVMASVTTFFVATTRALIGVIGSPSSEAARNAFVQAAKHNLTEIEKRIKVEPIPPEDQA